MSDVSEAVLDANRVMREAEQKREEYEELVMKYSGVITAFSWLSSKAASGHSVEIGTTERGNICLVIDEDGGALGATGVSLQAAIDAYRHGQTQNAMLGELEEPDDE